MDVLSRQYLLAVRELSELGTMTAAADALGVTVGAVSQQIAAMEKRLGVTVVQRVGRRVELTDAGRLLLLHAERLIAAQDEALAALEAARGVVAGTVTIGVFGSSAALLPGLVRSVADLHPGVVIRTREIDVDEALTAVRRGDVDLAFGLDYSDAPIPRVDGVRFDPLTTERIAVAMARSRGASIEVIDLSEGRDWDWILARPGTHYGDAMRAACRRAGFEPRVVHEVTDTASSLALAAAGQGVTPVTDLMRQLVPELPLRVQQIQQDVYRSLCLAEAVTEDRRPSARAVADVIRSVLKGPAVGTG